MHVVGHDDVTANADSADFPCFGELCESSVDGSSGENFASKMCVKRDEVKRRVKTLENERQPRRYARHRGMMRL
jgi:hypothetical protein